MLLYSQNAEKLIKLHNLDGGSQKIEKVLLSAEEVYCYSYSSLHKVGFIARKTTTFISQLFI